MHNNHITITHSHYFECVISFGHTPRFGVLPQADTIEHNKQQLGKDSPGPKYDATNQDKGNHAG